MSKKKQNKETPKVCGMCAGLAEFYPNDERKRMPCPRCKGTGKEPTKSVPTGNV